jgi:hypothetical protein
MVQAETDALVAQEAARKRRDKERKFRGRSMENPRTIPGMSEDNPRNVPGMSAEIPRTEPPKEINQTPETNKPLSVAIATSVPKAKRGERLPAGWLPAIQDQDWAIEELKLAPAVIYAATEEFRDYWAGVPGARGVKLDWPATWRNQMRRVAERKGAKAAPQVSPYRKAAAEFLQENERNGQSGDNDEQGPGYDLAAVCH